jgi:septal ring factor EnvC (AmiA/AmiB activator)
VKLLAASLILGTSQVLAVTSAPPQAGSGGWLVGVLVALLTGSMSASAFAFWRYKKQGKNERDDLIGRASKEAVEAARGMLDEYRRELERAKAAIRELEVKLQESNVRIANLERDLRTSEEAREARAAKLAAALNRRERQQRELVAMRQRVAQLEEIVDGPADAPG